MTDKAHFDIDAPEILNLRVRRLVQGLPVDRVDAVAGVGSGDIGWHGELEGGLPQLRLLEGAHHREDGAPPLDCTDGTGDIGAAVAHAVDMVKNGDNGRRAEEEIALCTLVTLECTQR